MTTTKHTALAAQCREPLASLNVNYGRGNIGSIHLGLDGAGRYEVLIPFTQGRYTSVGWRKFRIFDAADKLTVFALGHQKTALRNATKP